MKQMRWSFNLTLILCFFLLSPLTYAVTINVPADQPTIQSGIDVAQNGDTVLVDDGIYKGEGNVNIDFKGKGITLKSRNGAEATIIDCEEKENTRGLIFQNDETDASVLDGFTIKNGVHEHGGGIYLSYASPTIKNCVIDSNQSIGFGGIYCYNSDSIITDCTIIRNFGGGIFIMGRTEHKGVVLKETPAQPTLKNSTIAENTGNGVYCMDDVDPIITNCVVSHNSARGILYSYTRTDNPITNCRIEHNAGGGLEAWQGTVLKIENSIIVRNTAGSGGGIHCNYNSEIWVTDCVIAHNSANFGGGIQCDAILGSVNIKHCTITENTAGTQGGGISAIARQDPITLINRFNLTDSIIWGNSSNVSHAEVFVLGRGIVIKSCDIGDGLDGIGLVADGDKFFYEDNIDEDPLFVNAKAGDFTLQANSPAAGMGIRDPEDQEPIEQEENIQEENKEEDPLSVSQYGKRIVLWADIKRK